MLFSSIGVIGSGNHCQDVVVLLSRNGLDVRVVPWGRHDGRVGLWPTVGEGVEVHRDPAALYGCDLVIQQVPGSLERQMEAVRAIEPALSEGAILAIATTLAPIDRFVEVLRRPAQALGLVFPRPVEAGYGLELSVSEHTAPGVAVAMKQFCDAIGRPQVELLADAAE